MLSATVTYSILFTVFVGAFAQNATRQVMFSDEGDHERLCGIEGRLVKEKGNKLALCANDTECLPPSQCYNGYCCLVALNQEPPPVGCPFGTRSLRNLSGVELTCNPSQPNSCPGGAICYTDAMSGAKRCCGTDPGAGCPSGSKALMTANDKPHLCTPGSTTGLCPSGSLCQWSHLIDRYQCCQPDNGCPRHQAPIKTDRGVTITCKPGGPPCPGGASCQFNFWSAEYQCCRLDTADVCPVGQVPFLKETDGAPKSCKVDDDCPNGFLCGDNKICCGVPGYCPQTHFPQKDHYNRFTACSTRHGDTCPTGSNCLPTSIATQRLCCSQVDYKCPGDNLPMPNNKNPDICNLGDPYDCRGSQCMPSNVPGVSICCRSSFTFRQLDLNPCPSGWSPNNNQVTYCHPSTASSVCPGFSSCLLSNSVQQQFVCCVPKPRQARQLADSCRDPKAVAQKTRSGLKTCKSGGNDCGRGFSCQPSTRNGWLCCSTPRASAQITFSCPSAGQTAVVSAIGNNLFCSQAGQRAECPSSAVCTSAANSPQLLICCYLSQSSSPPSCPINSVPQPSSSGYVACDASLPSSCAIGYTCTRSQNDVPAQLCCSNSQQEPVCPNQQQLLMDTGSPRYCNPSSLNSCPSGYMCSPAVGVTGTYVCCTSTSSVSCPSNYAPRVDSLGNNIFCSPTISVGCPSGSSCIQSPQSQSLYLCCSSNASPRVCPNGQNAQLTGAGSLQTCSGPGTPCSQPGYNCQLSIVLAQYICCGQEPISATCADGREMFEQVAGTTYTCNPIAPSTGCPIGYDCSPSTVTGTNVCCANGFATPPSIINPPLQPSDGQSSCPAGWMAYSSEVDGQARTCLGPLDATCPAGFSCSPSLFAGQFLCCRLASALSCVNGKPFLANTQPRLCNRGRSNQCPRGYSCDQSNNPTVTICCSTSLNDVQVYCADGSLPALLNGNPRMCPAIGSTGGCPTGYICSKSTNGLNVCCNFNSNGISLASRQSPIVPPLIMSKIPSPTPIPSSIVKPMSALITSTASVCGPIAVAFIVNGHPIECTHAPTTCPTTHSCQPSFTNDKMYCCQEAQCPNGVSVGKSKLNCKNDAECGPNATCQKARNVQGLSICCASSVPVNTRCLLKDTQLRYNRPVECLVGSECDSGFECSSTTNNGRSVCCQTESSKSMPTCPENRLPLKNGNDFTYCDTTSFICPNRHICKSSNHSRPICCSEIPQCILGKAQFDNASRAPKTCVSNSYCLPGYSCAPSTVEGVTVCCSSTLNPISEPFASPTNLPTRAEIAKDDNNQEWVVIEG